MLEYLGWSLMTSATYFEIVAIKAIVAESRLWVYECLVISFSTVRHVFHNQKV